jgi:hypothetical protein
MTPAEAVKAAIEAARAKAHKVDAPVQVADPSDNGGGNATPEHPARATATMTPAEAVKAAIEAAKAKANKVGCASQNC